MLRGSPEVMDTEPDYSFWEEAIFRDEGYPKLFFVEREYAGDWTNLWIPNRACLEAMLRSAGFKVLNHPEDEVYVCGLR